MKKIFSFSAATVIITGLLLTAGCSKSSSKPAGTVTDPNKSVPDPVGTVTANISTSTSINAGAGTIAWIGPDNFNVSGSQVSICDMGAMKGLGNITNIPQTGFTAPASSNTTVACQPGHGYMVKFQSGTNVVYVRLYDAESIVNTSGGIMGAMVNYQFPFEPTSLTVSKDSLSFTGAQATQNVTVTTDASAWNFTSNASWLTATQNGNTLAVSASANSGLLPRSGVVTIQANEKSKTITVTQAAPATSAPYTVGSIYNENGVTGVVYKISSGGTHGMIVSLLEKNCAWSTLNAVTGCTDMDNGMNNMNTVKKIVNWDTHYPAFAWCDALNTGGVTGWYLPAINELNELNTNLVAVNTTLADYNQAQINSVYWSSTEYDINNAWLQYRNGKDLVGKSSGTFPSVRAVRAF